jgi:glycerophosphoryl diester phosphodiesterase
MHYLEGPRPRLFGHRGASGTRPENTIPAFVEALRAGADRLELDVHATADGEVVVFHDELLDRTTNGTGPLCELRLAKLWELDAGYHFTDSCGSHPFRGQGVRVPLLDEVLRAFPGVPLNIEIKADDTDLIDAVGRLLARHDARQRVLLTAEAGALMEKIRARAAEGPTGMSVSEVLQFLCAGGTPGYVPRGVALQVPVEHLGIPIVTPHFIDAARRSGLEVHVWTINEEAEMRRLLAMGVDGIMTDYPAIAARVLGRARD